MNAAELNPYLRSTGKSGWYWINYEPHVSCDQRIFVILENSATLTFYNRQGHKTTDWLLEAGDTVFFAAGTPYFFENATNVPFRYLCLSYDLTQAYRHIHPPAPGPFSRFDGAGLVDKPFDREGRQIDGQPFPILIQQEPTMRALCEQIWEEHYCRHPYYEEKCSALLKELLIDALRRSCPTGANLTANQPLATTILHYIDTRFQYPITVQDIAAALHYHPYYLSRVFARVYGVTPHQYLTQCRVTKALALLTNTDMPVGEVALRCGFVNVSHFSAAIRKVTGHSPTEIRKK